MVRAACVLFLLLLTSPALAQPPFFTFVFDDGWQTDYSIAADVFKRHGAVACAAITTSFINTPLHLTKDELLALKARGWEIQSHTVTHRSLGRLDPQEIDYELSGSKAELEAMGIEADNLAYPYNNFNANARAAAAKYYRSARGGGDELNRAPLELYALKSYAFTDDPASMRRAVDKAVSEGGWVMFYGHFLDAKVRVADYEGSFEQGEPLTFSPSGAKGMMTHSWWVPVYGRAVYFAPLEGTATAGDVIVGDRSGASARITSVVYNSRDDLDALLDYAMPRMRVVTVEQALDIYGVAPR